MLSPTQAAMTFFAARLTASGQPPFLPTSTGTTFDDTEAISGVTHYYWIAGRNEHGVATISDGETGTGGSFVFASQPDMLIGKRITSLRGNDIYNASGSGQKQTIRRKGRPIRFAAQLQNDTTEPDSFSLRGRRGNRKWKVKHYLLHGGRSNISAAVGAGTQQISDLSEMESRRLEIFTKAKGKTRKKRSTMRSWLQATSNHDGETDRVIGVSKNQPK